MNEARFPKDRRAPRLATTAFDSVIKHAQVGRLYVRQARLACLGTAHATKMASKIDRRIRSLIHAP